jgi:D-glycero-alpha-D-manno-heptose 1-phosphate guanylyltransferase
MMSEAIILAGGLGTRLRSVTNKPKCLATINNRPFLEYSFEYLISGGIKRVILSLGFKSDLIESHFGDRYKTLDLVYVVEEKRLGTGGAIKNAMKFCLEEEILILNGDSMFSVTLSNLYQQHFKTKAKVTIGLKPMQNFKRYGVVEIDENKIITNFLEKESRAYGLINGGVYIINKQTLKEEKRLGEIFSIEKDFFQASELVEKFGFVEDAFFLDIGIPEDYLKAQWQIGGLPKINKTWTLFLDRDGVINNKIDNDYVRTIQEFKFLPKVKTSIAILSKLFGRIIIVTNQQGVGKGLMTLHALEEIHKYLKTEISKVGGKIDQIYCAPALVSDQSILRKPNIGMALKAKEDFPEIDFSKSLMVGDSISDIEFGQKTGMISILISENKEFPSQYAIKSLSDFVELIDSALNE